MKRYVSFYALLACLLVAGASLIMAPPVGAAGLASQPKLTASATIAADTLACNLSPQANPSGYMSWWQQVSTNPIYQSQFWYDIVPNQTSACRIDVANTLWNSAVPDNWVFVANIGDWPWDSGGYFTQTLWLHAIPEEWAPIANTGGWNAPTGGYYAQYFWLHAVPGNLHSVANIGDWPWATGGYYTQWLWLHAVPDDWAPVDKMGDWPWDWGGYYGQWLWLHAVPQNLAVVPNIGGWGSSSGGYYAQWFWLHAVPDNWASRQAESTWPWDWGGYYAQNLWLTIIPDHAGSAYYDTTLWTKAAPQQWARVANLNIGGDSNVGYYYNWLYRFGTASGIAPRDDAILNGDSAVGYYAYQLQIVHKNDAALAPLTSLAGGYLANAASFKPVNQWYKSDAKAVVIFTFDAEGDRSQSCALRDVLNRHAVTATFFVMGPSIPEIAPCISGFDVQNHTVDHPPVSNPWDTLGFLSTYTTAGQISEIANQNAALKAAIPGINPTAFRTPWCDGSKSFDNSVAHSLLAAGMTTDSSIAVQMPAANGTPIPAEIRNYSVINNPSPFIIKTENGKNLVEFPFAFPSDYEAMAYGLNQNAGDPSRTNSTYAVNEWKNVFDQIYARRGTMVVIMHPWLQMDDAANTGAVDDLLTYMQSKSGTYFSNMTEARNKLRTVYGW